MRQDKAASSSPFSALTYREQQNRWMEWRSRQLDYKPFEKEKEKEKEAAQAREPHPEKLPRLRQPNMPIAAPYQRMELNQVLARHQKALRQAGSFQRVTADGPDNP